MEGLGIVSTPCVSLVNFNGASKARYPLLRDYGITEKFHFVCDSDD